MRINFVKMHGAGNDYIYVDGMKQTIPNESEAAKKLSDRHFSVGGDGLIIIKKGTVADYEMVMYNADGSRGAMCGNGIRCVAKYLYDHDYTDSTKFTIESMGKIKYIEVFTENGKAVSLARVAGHPAELFGGVFVCGTVPDAHSVLIGVHLHILRYCTVAIVRPSATAYVAANSENDSKHGSSCAEQSQAHLPGSVEN